MKLFINDIPVHVKGLDHNYSPLDYDTYIDGPDDEVTIEKLVDYVLIRNASPFQIEATFRLMRSKKLKGLDEITFTVQDKKTTKKFIKNKFTIIEAAGGLVEKNDKILMIHRLGKWDLPKGKLDKKEKRKGAAVREVEEECNIKVILGEKICATWHTYTQNGKGILKKTSWYAMECIDDSKMKPQEEEDIDEVRWMDGRELRPALYNSYRSVRHVFNEFYMKKKKIS